MFSVYGVSGRLFMGAASDMPQVPGVRSLLRAKAVGAIGLDPTASETGENQRRASVSGAPGVARPLAAYEGAVAPQRRPLTLVQDVMTRQPVTAGLAESASAVIEPLRARGWACVPVVNERHQLVGILPLRGEPPPVGAAVADVMWSPVPSVALDTDVRQVARALLDTGLTALPVVDALGEVLGLVTRSDLLGALAHDPPLDLWS